MKREIPGSTDLEDIFISYAHEDIEFASKLSESLFQNGYATWGDWKIGGAHEWRKEVWQALEKTNTFIFIITPEAVSSEECRKEADYAEECQKRIIPILYQNIPDFKLLHPAIEQHQCINFRESDDFQKSLQILIRAIETDLAYVRLHARLLQRALDWERGNQDESFLLRGKDLAAVRQQLVENVKKEPPLNPLQKEYFITSGLEESARLESASRKQRVGLAVTGALLLLAVGSSLFGWYSYRVAKKETIRATLANSKMLFASGKGFDALKIALQSHRLYAKSRIPLGNLQEEIISTLQYAVGFVHVPYSVEEKHAVYINDLVASADGRHAASSDSDGKVVLWKLDGSSRTCFAGNQAGVYDLAFSPDGRVLASVGKEGILRLCYTDGQPVKTLDRPHDGKGWEVSFSPDGKFLASSDSRGRVFLRKANGTFLKSLGAEATPNAEVTYFSFSPNSQTLATASKDGTVKLWTVEGRLLRSLTARNSLQAHNGAVKHLAFSPDGKVLVTAGADRKIRIWTLAGKLLETLDRHKDVVSRVVFSPDGQAIASTGYDKSVNLWRKDGTLIQTLSGPDFHRDIVDTLAFSPNSQFLLTGSRDKTIKLWKQDGSFVETLQGHTDWVKHVAVVPHQKLLTLVSGGFDKTIRFWKIDRTLVTRIVGHQSTVQRVAFSSDGSYLASIDNNNALKLWRDGVQLPLAAKAIAAAFHPEHLLLATGDETGKVTVWEPKGSTWIGKDLGQQSGAIYQIRFSPDGLMLATAGKNGDARLWPVKGKSSIPLKDAKWVASNTITDIRFSPDGKLVATADDSGRLQLWQTDGKYLRDLEGHKQAAYQVKFSRDGAFVVAASRDKKVQLWKTDGTALPLDGKEPHEGEIWDVDISPDSQLVASASTDNTVKLWQPSGAFIKTLKGHEAEVRQVSFSADGQFLASASTDNTVKIWRRDGTLFKTLQGHSAPVMLASFSPKNDLMSADESGSILLWHSWNWDVQQLVDYGCDRLKDYIAQHPDEPPLCDRPGQRHSSREK
ncbi:toll/interleukin-1 receptor domain-containing protein [Altericista sp. CCNU0014]|uniref:toll/interleukin-1 receptor domain-containing protein n=1 Tax=Altericista sp. CCNU0014 TaxID=3082949 RepID=UPI00384BE0F7